KSRRSGDCSCRNNGLRPTLIFAAAAKNGPPAGTVAAQKNSPSAAPSWGAGRDRMPRRRHNPK
ncbi:MAG: hypothetical protein PUF43_07025, partial [Bacteroidales bacterium]|nr:hypothetical protein [Bacteroidales bacterium]